MLTYALAYLITELATTYIAFGDGWTLIWPLNGVTVALLIKRPRASWIWILLGIEAGSALGGYLAQSSFSSIMYDRLCGTVEVVICAALLPRFDALQDRLRTPGLFTRFIAAIVLGPGISTLLAWVIHPYYQHESLSYALRSWGLADTLGIGATMPLTLAAGSPQMRALLSRNALPQTFGVVALVLASVAMIFSTDTYPLEVFLFPLLLLFDSILGFAGSALVIVGVMIISVYSFTSGVGPFASWPGSSPIPGELATPRCPSLH